MTPSRIAVIAGDPGGANALAPVIASLARQGHALTLFAYRQAVELWKNRAWKVVEPPEGLSELEAVRFLSDAEPCVLLTATSANGVDLERLFIAAARRLGMPMLTVLDSWSAYAERFSGPAGRLAYLPDRVAIMDELARNEMIVAGFPPTGLVITGQPAFDELNEIRRAFGPTGRVAWRSRLGVSEGGLLVVFFSQPIAALYPPSHPRHPGYTEHDALGALVRALEEIAGDTGRAVTLLIRPHPREVRCGLLRYASPAIQIRVGEEGDRRHMALAADLVTGMTTIALVESCLLGCLTLSLQPGLAGPDLLPTSRSGATRAVYAGSAIAAAVRELLCDPEAQNAVLAAGSSVRHNPGAAERVVQVLDQLLLMDRPNVAGAMT